MKGYRFMRVIVFFDLPVQTAYERKEYRRFRNYLLKKGFIMMQESVYMKLAINHSIVNSIKRALERIKPAKGLIQVLVITEKQYLNMQTLVGQNDHDIIDSDKRMIIL